MEKMNKLKSWESVVGVKLLNYSNKIPTCRFQTETIQRVHEAV